MDSTVPWNTAEYSAEVSQVDLILDHGLSVLVFFFFLPISVAHKESTLFLAALCLPFGCGKRIMLATLGVNRSKNPWYKRS